MKHALFVISSLLPLLLASCGTTSSVTDAQGVSITDSTRKFARASVQTFQSSVTDPEDGVASAQNYFADRIVSEMKQAGGFRSVSRNAKADADTLVVDGVITRYGEGNPTLRFMIGMGAGSSYFDATVRFKDSRGNVLGTVAVDKNSWVLGGGLAATQNPKGFMDGAAGQIAAESRKFAR